MTEHIPSMEPTLVIYSDAPEEIRERALALDQAVKEKPTQYLLLLANLGSTAVSSMTEGEAPVEGDQLAIVKQFFSERLDLHTEFDSETENSLEVNNRYIQLQGERKHATEIGSKAQEEQIRTRLRYFRLEHYISRILTWQELNKQKTGESKPFDPKALETETADVAPYPRSGSEQEDLRTAI